MTLPAAMRQLSAPLPWRLVDFISDLHLQEGEQQTFDVWHRFMQTTPADAIFILGDLFDAWVGDDAALEPGFEEDCAQILRAASARTSLFFMHGNRDFLVGDPFAALSGMTLLEDPTVFEFAGGRWLLSHGDMLCLDDAAYQDFRLKVRAPQWRRDFLSHPLGHRRETVRQMRKDSDAHQRTTGRMGIVAECDARAWLDAAGATTLIHGHTHAPAEHAMRGGLRRVVLSDWDASAVPPRCEVVRVSARETRRIALR